jgi:hypothetical protein
MPAPVAGIEYEGVIDRFGSVTAPFLVTGRQARAML